MQPKLGSVLSALVAIAAVAYVLGWIQAYYYFDTFGIRLASVGMLPQDYLVNSWFLLQNVVFFLVLIWVITNTPRWWTWMIGAGYFLIPIAAHYAFFAPEWRAARFLIEYRHTLLKFIPFGLLVGVMLADRLRGSRPAGRSIDLPRSPRAGWVALLVVIVGAWSVSAAKHFGSYDANLELRRPDIMLATVRLHAAPGVTAFDALTASGPLYLVHATPTQLFIWDAAGFSFGQPDQKVTIHVIARDTIAWLETTRHMQIQRGSFIF